tara:strand:+ start:195 stop:440 length:246 start_codon:yes stop_codon:yes gene_type:complete
MYTLITRTDCEYCDKAKVLLKAKGVIFTTYNIEETSSKWILTLMKEANIKTVPQIFSTDGSLVGGYRDLESLVEFIGGKEY